MFKGFFTPEELEAKIQIDFEFDAGPNCEKCGLYRKCNSPKMKYTGEGKKNVLIIAEAPGQNEDLQGIQLIGDAGQLLRNELKKYNLDLDRDFWKTNAISCRPTTSSGANRQPTKSEIKYCKPLVDKTINDLKPKMIWLMGGKAVESFYMNRFSNLSINRWRKLCIPDRKTGAWVIPLFHPSYINRQKYDDNLRTTFERDLKWAVSCINKDPFTWQDEREDVVPIYKFDYVVECLSSILLWADESQVNIYLDYETNSLKPQWPGAKIATIALCPDIQGKKILKLFSKDNPYFQKLQNFSNNPVSIAFAYQYSDYFNKQQQNKIKFLLRKMFTHSNICWIAHNIKFEDSWTRKILGVRPKNWLFDTMIAAHIEDNRSRYTGLKFQSYIKFGLEPYNKEIDQYLKPKHGHFNQIDKAPLDQLLLYNGLDTTVGMKLYREQKKIFTLSSKLHRKHKLTEAYKLFHDGVLAFSDIQANGIRIDEEYYERENKKITYEIKELKEKLKNSKEAKQFRKKRGKELDVASNKDLGELFYEVLGLEAQLTAKENYRVDEDALSSIKIPFVKTLMELRKKEKAKGTYFSQITREVCGGFIYPFYDLHIPRSGRSSSSMPNWQNIPSHDPEIGKLIRSGVFPSKGNKLVEIDFSNIEVRVAAMYTKDPTLVAEVTSDDADMHRDTALDIWMIPLDELNKDVRYLSKGVNFGLFYGATYKKVSETLWKGVNTKINSRITLKQHIRNKGIKNYLAFEDHCQEFVDYFWNERFKEYQRWKDKVNTLYRKQGWIENYFGFRFVGYMSDRVVSNYPIQSTAFHILLDSLIRIINRAKEEGWKSKIVGQIHDSILIDLVPEEEDYVLKTCLYEMSEHSRELYDWITVPIPANVEITEIDQPWSMKKEIEI